MRIVEVGRRIALVVVATAALSGCGPGERAWRSLASNVPEGMMMAGAMVGGAPLLVGGQAKVGAAWRLVGGQLKGEAVPAGPLLTWASQAADGSTLVVGTPGWAVWRGADGSWSPETLPAAGELWGCLAWSRDEAFAVGGDALQDGTYAPVLLWRHGGAWSRASLPVLSRQGARLFKVDGHTPIDVVAVGEQGLALRWGGAAWTEEATGTGTTLTTVRALADGRYVAVGGQASGVVLLREAGGGWRTLREAPTGLSGVDGWDGAVWVAGLDGWIEQDRLDGGAPVTVKPSPTRDTLHWVLRLPSGDGLAGGGNLEQWPGTMHGTLLEWAR